MRRLLFFSLLLFSYGCAGPKVNFSRNYDFSQLNRVGVSRFEGQGGAAAADLLSHSLLGAGADVVERSRLEAVLVEQRLSNSGIVSPDTARALGRILGVDAIFIGSVLEYSSPESYLVMGEGSGFAFRSVSSLGRQGRTFSSAPASAAPGASILTSSAHVALTARLVDVETGAIIWSAHQSYEGFDLQSAMASLTDAFADSLMRVWRGPGDGD